MGYLYLCVSRNQPFLKAGQNSAALRANLETQILLGSLIERIVNNGMNGWMVLHGDPWPVHLECRSTCMPICLGITYSVIGLQVGASG
jgi:hypothetical protein